MTTLIPFPPDSAGTQAMGEAPECALCSATLELQPDPHAEETYYCQRCLADAREPFTLEDLGVGD